MIEYVQFFPTLRCNFSCGFCFNRFVKTDKDFPEGGIGALVDWLKDNSIPQLDILGGEPTLFRPIPALVEAVMDAGLIVWLSSNGSDMALLRSLQDTGARVGVSINSCSIAKQMADVIDRRFHIKALYTKKNGPLIEALLALEVNHRYILYPDVMVPEQAGYSVPFFQFYEDYNNKLKGLGFEAVFCEGFLSAESLSGRCPAGQKKLTVMPDGGVYPCYLLAHRKEFLLGSIFEHSLEEILSRPALEFFSRFTGSVCPHKTCPVYERCRGGCPAHALMHYGTLQGPDPRCMSWFTKTARMSALYF